MIKTDYIEPFEVRRARHREAIRASRERIAAQLAAVNSELAKDAAQLTATVVGTAGTIGLVYCLLG